MMPPTEGAQAINKSSPNGGGCYPSSIESVKSDDDWFAIGIKRGNLLGENPREKQIDSQGVSRNIRETTAEDPPRLSVSKQREFILLLSLHSILLSPLIFPHRGGKGPRERYASSDTLTGSSSITHKSRKFTRGLVRARAFSICRER